MYCSIALLPQRLNRVNFVGLLALMEDDHYSTVFTPMRTTYGNNLKVCVHTCMPSSLRGYVSSLGMHTCCSLIPWEGGREGGCPLDINAVVVCVCVCTCHFLG